MQSLSRRATTGLIFVCLFFLLVITSVGAVAISGLRVTENTATSVAHDELTTGQATASLARQVDSVYEAAESFSSAANPRTRAVLGSELFNNLIPGADTAMAALSRLHADDPPAELGEIRLLGRQWSTFRSLLDPYLPGSPAAGTSLSETQVQVAFRALSTHLAGLIAKEVDDAQRGDQATSSRTAATAWLIIALVVLAAAAAAALVVIGRRRIRRAVQPGQDQIEFSDTMQLAENQDEAHQLLCRHLERAITASVATVLNRNNSADRLEAITERSPRLVPHPHPCHGRAQVVSGHALRAASPRRCQRTQPPADAKYAAPAQGSAICTPLDRRRRGDRIGAHEPSPTLRSNRGAADP